MRGRVWSIPAIAAYFYVATILAEYGYNSYFGIPPDFVRASLSENIIYFFQLLTASKDALGQIGLLMWVVVVVVAAFIVFLYYYHWLFKTIFGAIGTGIFFLFLLWGSFNIGKGAAINTTYFWVLSPNCLFAENGSEYIIPTISDSWVVLIPIDKQNTMKGGFLVRNINDIPCTLEYKNIGKITN